MKLLDRKLIDYFPSFLQEYEELKIIANTGQTEVEEAWKATEKLLEEPFVYSQNNYGASRLEKILEIKPLDTDTLEVRNFRILSKLNEVLPYTYRTIRKYLNNMCGEAKYQLKINIDKLAVDAVFEIEEKQKLRELFNYLERIVPLNLIILFAGRNRLEFIQKIQYKNILRMKSEFFPRYNRPLLILDASWEINGNYSLNGYKDNKSMDFYPLQMQIISFTLKHIELKNQLNLKAYAGLLIDKNSILKLKSDAEIKKKAQAQLLVKNTIHKKISTKENLTIEKDLWYLDGKHLLDGVKLLDAEIIEHRL